jgi:thioredoxin 1
VTTQLLTQDRSPIPESSTKIHKITSLSELSTLFKSHTHVIVDFYADWCPPCRAIAPVFGKLADEHAVDGKLAFAKVNVDHVKDVAAKYGVRAMPTFLMFEDGERSEVVFDGRVVSEVKGADVGLLRKVVGVLGEQVAKM